MQVENVLFENEEALPIPEEGPKDVDTVSCRNSHEGLVSRVQRVEAQALEETASGNTSIFLPPPLQNTSAANREGDVRQEAHLIDIPGLPKTNEVPRVAPEVVLVNIQRDQELATLQQKLSNALAENAALKATHEHERIEKLDVQGSSDNTTPLRNAVRELTRQNRALESRVDSLRTALLTEKNTNNELSARLQAAEGAASEAAGQAEAACRERDEALLYAQQAQHDGPQSDSSNIPLTSARRQVGDAGGGGGLRGPHREQLSVMSDLALRRGAALSKIIELLGADESHDLYETKSSRRGVPAVRAVHPEKAVDFVYGAFQSIVDAEDDWEKERTELHEALREAEYNTETLRRNYNNEKAQREDLECQVAELKAAVRAGPRAPLDAQAAEIRVYAAEAALEACREELSEAAARAAASVLEASQLKAAVAAAEARVQAAEDEAVKVRSGAGARDQRADEMRSAAAVAMDVSGELQRSIREACEGAVKELQQTAALLSLPMDTLPGARLLAGKRFTPNIGDTQQRSEVSSFEVLLDSVYSCIDHLQAAVVIADGSPENGAQLGTLVHRALQEASRGLGALASLVQEHGRVYSALSRAVGGIQQAGTAADTTTAGGLNFNYNRHEGGTQEGVGGGEQWRVTSLDSLLSELLDCFSTLTDGVQNEKAVIESDLLDLQSRYEDLVRHADSLESVLRSAVHAGVGSDTAGETLIELAAARRRVAELEEECAELAEAAQQAQHALSEAKATAARDWDGVRADVVQLVQHAERAQHDAEAAMQKQRAEAAREVAEARSKEHAAAAKLHEAEATAAKLREESNTLSRELQLAQATAQSWENRATAAESALLEGAAQSRGAAATAAGDPGGSSRYHQQQFSSAGASAPEQNNNNRPGSRQNEAVLMQRIHQLEHELMQIQHQAGKTAMQLMEARSRAEVAESAAAQHKASADAAQRRAESAANKAADAQKELATLEMKYLEEQTSHAQAQARNLEVAAERREQQIHLQESLSGQQQHQQFANNTSLALQLTSPPALPLLQSSYSVAALQAEEELRVLMNVPANADASALRRRLEAALRQVASLRALNTNLEQQLFVAVQQSRRLLPPREQARSAIETAHAMIDALQAQMASAGLDTQKRSTTASTGEGNRSGANETAEDSSPHAPSPVEGTLVPRVVDLWRQACAARDAKLQDAERRLRAADAALDAKEAELAAMEQAAAGLAEARQEAIQAATEMENRLRGIEEERRDIELEAAAAVAALEDQGYLQQRVASLESSIREMENRAAAATARATKAERALAAEQAQGKAAAEWVRRAEEAEKRTAAAETRAAEAESALAHHLESSSKHDATSLGRQLEQAWVTEAELAARIQELQAEAAGAKSELESAIRELERQTELSRSYQEQLREAIDALAEQGAALEALQQALREERGRSGWDSAPHSIA